MPAPALNCASILASLIPSCDALTSVGGVQPFVYYAHRSDLVFTYATDGSITGVALTTTGKLAKGIGRKFQNSGAYESARSATGKARVKQTYIDRVYHDTQADRNAIQQLILAEDVVFITPNNSLKFEVYGAALGLIATSVKGGTGTKLDDDNTVLFSFEGDEPTLPAVFNTVTVTPGVNKPADFAANVTYLDALVNI